MQRALIVALLLIAGCSKALPTEPDETERAVSTEAVVGVWATNLAVHPADEDWAPVVMTITTSPGGLEGFVTPRVGRPRPLEIGAVANGRLPVTIQDLYTPAPTPCTHLGFMLTTATYRNGRVIALDGTLGGRCPNTIVNQKVRFARQ